MRWAEAGMRTSTTAARRWCVTRPLWVMVLSLLGIAGCGVAANPQPPTLWLPAPVKDLTAIRVGSDVRLHWTMPTNTTDKVALRGDQQAHVCWNFAPGFDAKTCRSGGDGMFSPGKAADFTVHLPPELTTGAPRAVAFYVELQNHAGKTAGPSHGAWVASGMAPAPVTGLQLETRAEGVVLRWQPSAIEPGLVMRIHRELVKTPSAPKPDEAKGVPPSEEQTLEVKLDQAGGNSLDPGGAVDHDATLDREWKYWLERVARVKADGHELEMAGLPSPTVSIAANDLFPPTVPENLAVVADAQARAMDLSWTPDSDEDIAGYIVYRRDVTAGGPMQRITEKVVVPPSYSDTNVVTGHKYAYAVSAVDLDGNESAKSGEVEEELTQ